MLTFNFFLTCIAIWVIIFINSRFLIPALLNRERFKLFALRDELAMLAMRRVIMPDSNEYLILLKLLNSSITVLGTFSIVDFLKFLLHINRDMRIRKQVDEIMNTLNHRDESYRSIVQQYFAVIQRMLLKQTGLFRNVLYPIFYFIRPVKNRAELIEQIELNINMRLEQAEMAMHNC